MVDAASSELSGTAGRRAPLQEVERAAEPLAAALPLEAAAPPLSLTARLRRLFPGGQFLRYLIVGVFNTVFGYVTYAIAFALLGRHMQSRLLYLAAPFAAVLSTPLNITFAFFNYKFFVFKTQGNYLREWLKCFAVYGIGMLPGLVALGALTRLLQALLQRHAASLHRLAAVLQAHFGGSSVAWVVHHVHARDLAGYLAGAIVIGFSTIYSFLGHKKVTFRSPVTTE